MRILYGVVGEGMGHATRSRVVLEHLVKSHEVHVVSSGRAEEYLARRFSGVHGIWGLTIAYGENTVKTWQTVLQNVKGAVSGWPENIRQYFRLVDQFAPEVVISDFESFSYLFGRNHFLPVISIDNMQLINRCKHDSTLLQGYERDFALSKAIVKSKLPGSFHYLITTFFYPEVRKKRTTLVPPILRSEILAARPELGDHLLIYQTSTTNLDLPVFLKRLERPCRIYGMKREISADWVDQNLTYRPFSESAFIEDLRTACGVIAGGGFTLMSECVYLRKPMLSLPIQGQFEQILNALYLEKLGYGRHARELNAATIEAFLNDLPACRQKLESYHQNGNVEMLAALDRQLERARRRGRAAFDDDG